MPDNRVAIAGSERADPDVASTGLPDPAEVAEISIYLKRQEPAPEAGTAGPRISREDLRAARTKALQPAIAAVGDFAKSAGLQITETDPARRMVKIKGSLADLEAAFGTRLQLFDHGAGPYRARSGSLTAPSEVANLIEAVLGLDQRPIATPKLVRRPLPHATAGNLPNAVTAHYGFPQIPGAGQGECIAIIELGGGVSTADTDASFKAMGIAPPIVAPIPVSGGANQPGKDPDSDGEVALDVQVSGAGAPGATLAVYFAPNTDQGFVDAITQAVHDAANKPSVMSISWGSAESVWTGQSVTAMNSAFQDAADVGVSVFAASGDGLATDGVTDGKAHVDFPASSPWVVGCGGTTLGAGSAAETVWNSNGGGSGGGISDLFPPPVYQADIHLPKPAKGANPSGRGVPDVSGDADPDTGYRVVVDGRAQLVGGTSAVAPLWAGLFALINARAGKPAGQPHAAFYAAAAAFNDVTKGDNKSSGVGYTASVGWDACTGLGTPKGAAVAALFPGG